MAAMEGSHVLKDLEDEHSSSESGWTMYIGTSIHENDHYNYIGEYSYHTFKQEEGYEDKNRCRNCDGNDHNDDDSDDSMASDASSGPSHHKLPSSSEQNPWMDHYTHQSVKSISTEKLQKQVIERDQRRNNTGKEKLELKTISAASHVQSRAKVKMTNYLSQKE